MTDQWLYRQGDDVVGPLPLAELFTLLDEGTIPPDTEVWAIGSSNAWTPANRRDDLASYRRALGARPELVAQRELDPTRPATFQRRAASVVGGLGGLLILAAAVFFGLPLIMESTTDPCQAADTLITKRFLLGEDLQIDPEELIRQALTRPAWLVCTTAYWDLML